MCSHLNSLIPGNVATDLHQDFWRHRRACARCDGKHSKHSHEYQSTKCCLEHLIKDRDVLEKSRKGAKADDDDKPVKTPRPKKPLTQVQRDLLWLARHEKKLAKGYICRRYDMDDDFDAGKKTGQQKHAYFADHRGKIYDAIPVVMTEEDDSNYEQLVVSKTKF
ncbi:hypothetical protein PV04_01713 [Phialophora macrospora]|uniref:Uncharacterized protein n=1 Tax=Phialophora macrospora TaxID=1851006 RepID=A0A0D2G496_9EURO|nr:hypothetical protein PV04_01713 [Phialophora macrospora]